MSENRLEITRYQFEVLINLPVVKASYSYFISDLGEEVEGKFVSNGYERGIRFAGIDYVVVE